MLNELRRCLRHYEMVKPGDRVICAVSGGADSVALLFAMYLCAQELGITLAAAHFNHRLRAQESDSEEAFVRALCDRLDIALHVGSGTVKPGKKGLEAAARDARYAFFDTLDGIIATAHTADDNAETVLMHLLRGTGLKGLGGIAPVSGNRIRPMLNCTREQVESFLREYNLTWCTDSSNETDAFLRNRLRHHVIPLLKAENPRFGENVSAMAQRLRQDDAALEKLAQYDFLPDVAALRQMPDAVRSRVLERFLKENGVCEPQSQHIALAQSLVFSDKPSAMGNFPGGITVCREYDRLTVRRETAPLCQTPLLPDAQTEAAGYAITVMQACLIENTKTVFTVTEPENLRVRAREAGDAMRLSGGTKSLKKLFVDRKIPAAERLQIPVIADDGGVLGVYGIGVNLDRAAENLPAVRIEIKRLNEENAEDRENG